MNYDEQKAKEKAKFEAFKHVKPSFTWLHVSTQVRTDEAGATKIVGVMYNIGANKTKRALRAMKKAHNAL